MHRSQARIQRNTKSNDDPDKKSRGDSDERRDRQAAEAWSCVRLKNHQDHRRQNQQAAERLDDSQRAND